MKGLGGLACFTILFVLLAWLCLVLSVIALGSPWIIWDYSATVTSGSLTNNYDFKYSLAVVGPHDENCSPWKDADCDVSLLKADPAECRHSSRKACCDSKAEADLVVASFTILAFVFAFFTALLATISCAMSACGFGKKGLFKAGLFTGSALSFLATFGALMVLIFSLIAWAVFVARAKQKLHGCDMEKDGMWGKTMFTICEHGLEASDFGAASGSTVDQTSDCVYPGFGFMIALYVVSMLTFLVGACSGAFAGKMAAREEHASSTSNVEKISVNGSDVERRGNMGQ
eukprot:NODE_1962_length_1239_cov_66.905882_g1627_i0.p2 GENE.NODE_1962_length_1239_cov_66.905882_g1627_i0~~NODE_1962_length_1239_cov_66.905882_g1627_i0.p2  ORF type:complete len:287 (+),score=74.82 NODE_1962_length_1239_cov_66.905882_g1627_i0:130-990(+)